NGLPPGQIYGHLPTGRQQYPGGVQKGPEDRSGGRKAGRFKETVPELPGGVRGREGQRQGIPARRGGGGRRDSGAYRSGQRHYEPGRIFNKIIAMDQLDRLIKERIEMELRAKTRRHFIKDCVTGMGGLALGSFLMSCNSFTSPNKKGRIALTERDI